MIKENINLKNKVFSVFKTNNLGYKIVVGFMLFIMPIYPMLAWIIYTNTEYDFYRWFIDEDSILFSYEESERFLISDWIDQTIWEFIIDRTLLNEERNYDWTNEIRQYVVESWDSISVIAAKFKVSKNTIYDFNNFTRSHILRPGDIIKIPATSWINYKVKSGDTLSWIANRYKINKKEIVEFNPELSKRELRKWEEIFLPWAKNIIQKPKRIATQKTNIRASTNIKKTKHIKNENISSGLVYKSRWRKPYSWAWWNCTYYVASHKNVNWRWNANQWMRNAAKKWHKIVRGRGFKPKLWAIVVLEGRWYNLRYGHVAIVREIREDYMIVSDMNFRKLNQITYRKVSLNSRNITGYIHVD